MTLLISPLRKAHFHLVVTPDYENPADKNRDNIYQVTVEARDPGFNVAPADVTVTVLNVDERGYGNPLHPDSSRGSRSEC